MKIVNKSEAANFNVRRDDLGLDLNLAPGESAEVNSNQGDWLRKFQGDFELEIDGKYIPENPGPVDMQVAPQVAEVRERLPEEDDRIVKDPVEDVVLNDLSNDVDGDVASEEAQAARAKAEAEKAKAEEEKKKEADKKKK